MKEFWQTFLPDLAAGIVSLIVGIPIGLWLNRRFAAHAKEERRREVSKRVGEALRVLGLTLEANRAELLRFGAVLNAHTLHEDARLNLLSWEAATAALDFDLKDPSLKHQLASHFSRLRGFDHSASKHSDLEKSPDGSPQRQAAGTSKLLRSIEELIRETYRLQIHLEHRRAVVEDDRDAALARKRLNQVLERALQYPMTFEWATGTLLHVWNTNETCRRCGVSKDSAAYFHWPCKIEMKPWILEG